MHKSIFYFCILIAGFILSCQPLKKSSNETSSEFPKNFEEAESYIEDQFKDSIVLNDKNLKDTLIHKK